MCASHGMSLLDLLFKGVEGSVKDAHLTQPPHWQGAIVAVECAERKLFGLQYHPEVMHSERGTATLRRFLFGIADIPADWKIENVLEEEMQKLRQTVRTQFRFNTLEHAPTCFPGISCMLPPCAALHIGCTSHRNSCSGHVVKCCSLLLMAIHKRLAILLTKEVHEHMTAPCCCRWNPTSMRSMLRKPCVSLFPTSCCQVQGFHTVHRDQLGVMLLQVGLEEHVICALSGGVDSTVAATLVHKVVGDRLHCVFVDNGLLRFKVGAWSACCADTPQPAVHHCARRRHHATVVSVDQ